MKFRVLWIDPTGEGRFTTVEVARSAMTVADGETCTFEAIERTDKPRGRS